MNCAMCTSKIYPRLNYGIDLTHKDILIIGESVTAVEVKQNKIMSGGGGDILRQTMSKVGLPIDNASVAYTTAVHCAIPKIKGKNLFTKEVMNNCRQRLLDEIKAIKPQMILVCGKVAMITLTGNHSIKITEEYGRVREYDFIPGVKVIPIMNPGLILHSPGDYKPFLTMLQLASTIFKGGTTIKTGETKWTVLDTNEKCIDLYNRMCDLSESDPNFKVSFDIETTGLDYRYVDFLVMGILFEKNHAYIIPREIRKVVHNFIEGAPWKCIWQGGKYDKKVMWKRQLGSVSIDEDTMYLHYVLDETSEHGLGYLSKVYLNAEEYKYKMNQNWKSVTLESYPKFFDALCERVAVDCDYTYQLCDVLHKEVDKEPALKTLYEKLLIPASNFLSRVEQNGIAVDAPYLTDMDKKYDIVLLGIEQEIKDLSTELWDLNQYMIDTGAKSGSDVFNPGSPKQMSWMVFDRLKLKPRIKKGRSTDKDILNSIEPKPKFVAKVLEYRKVQKEQSTYVQGLLKAQDDDCRVRTNFTLHIAATGRLTSKEPNVQNQPSAHGVGNIRRAFVARPGYVLAEIDYSGAELRWLAFMSKCPVLLDIFMNGKNLHHETATALFGAKYNKPQKMRAKAVNFGIPYGREEKSFVDEFNITMEEAEAMISGWLNKYYGARDYLDWCANQVVLGNYLETLFGRRRRFGLVSNASLHALQNEARNFPIQSSSSDLLLVCGMDLEEPLAKLDTRIINLVHDSLLLEIPADESVIAEVGQLSNKIMVQKPIDLFNCPVPFKTDFEVGNTWGDLIMFDYSRVVFTPNEDDLNEVLTFTDWQEQIRKGVHFGH